MGWPRPCLVWGLTLSLTAHEARADAGPSAPRSSTARCGLRSPWRLSLSNELAPALVPCRRRPCAQSQSADPHSTRLASHLGPTCTAASSRLPPGTGTDTGASFVCGFSVCSASLLSLRVAVCALSLSVLAEAPAVACSADAAKLDLYPSTCASHAARHSFHALGALSLFERTTYEGLRQRVPPEDWAPASAEARKAPRQVPLPGCGRRLTGPGPHCWW